MKSDIVDVNETRRDLTVEVPSTVVDEAIGRAAAKIGRAAKIPGFRPGKVPATVVRQRFKGEIMQDVAETLISRAVGDALTERGIEPIATPDIQDLRVFFVLQSTFNEREINQGVVCFHESFCVIQP